MTIINVFQSHDQNIVVLVEHSILHFVYHIHWFLLSSFLIGRAIFSYKYWEVVSGMQSSSLFEYFSRLFTPEVQFLCKNVLILFHDFYRKINSLSLTDDLSAAIESGYNPSSANTEMSVADLCTLSILIYDTNSDN
jgi:predicted Zn-dependent protease with MMP-like domain